MASILTTLVTGFNLTAFPSRFAPSLTPSLQQECINACPLLIGLRKFKTKTPQTLAPVPGGVTANQTSAVPAPDAVPSVVGTQSSATASSTATQAASESPPTSSAETQNAVTVRYKVLCDTMQGIVRCVRKTKAFGRD